MKKAKDLELDDPKKAPAPKQVRLSPAAADRILEKVDRLTKR
jgi:hypothetical protein